MKYIRTHTWMTHFRMVSQTEFVRVLILFESSPSIFHDMRRIRCGSESSLVELTVMAAPLLPVSAAL